jgi:phospholipid transport system substrate-binding protein
MALAEMPIDKATSFIDALGRGLMETINGTETAPAKTASLEKIIETNVDTASVARFCIGRFWRIATADQQKEYMALFHQVLVKNITGRVGDYQGVLIVTNRAAAREDGIAVTTTVTRPNNAPNRVDWLVADEGGKPQVIDVIAEGTSVYLLIDANSGNIPAGDKARVVYHPPDSKSLVGVGKGMSSPGASRIEMFKDGKLTNPPRKKK